MLGLVDQLEEIKFLTLDIVKSVLEGERGDTFDEAGGDLFKNLKILFTRLLKKKKTILEEKARDYKALESLLQIVELTGKLKDLKNLSERLSLRKEITSDKEIAEIFQNIG